MRWNYNHSEAEQSIVVMTNHKNFFRKAPQAVRFIPFRPCRHFASAKNFQLFSLFLNFCLSETFNLLERQQEGRRKVSLFCRPKIACNDEGRGKPQHNFYIIKFTTFLFLRRSREFLPKAQHDIKDEVYEGNFCWQLKSSWALSLSRFSGAFWLLDINQSECMCRKPMSTWKCF